MTAEQVSASNAAFRAALHAPATGPVDGRLVGIEHEYRLLRGRERVDFRDLIHTLPVPGRRLDPGDLNAYRLTSGLALTCDDAEAEIASPPLEAGPGFAAALHAWASEGHARLRALLPADVEIEGYSTHLSVSVPEDLGDEVAHLFSVTFAPALMLLFDVEDGLGVYVRPRPGRLEFCGEYLTGPLLRAAATFLVGAVRACIDGVRNRYARATLPLALAVNLRPATSRFGYYVGRRLAFGFDLYAAGRGAPVPTATGASISQQEHLEQAWRAARPLLAGDAASDDVALIEELLRGAMAAAVPAAALPGIGPPGPPSPAPDGRILGLAARDGLSAEAVAATWDFTVVRIASDRGRVFALLPRPSLGRFLDAWPAGRLDEIIHARIAGGTAGRRLASRTQAREPGLWDEVEPSALLPAERDSGGAYVAAPKKRGRARAGKVRVGKATAPAARPRRPILALPPAPPPAERPRSTPPTSAPPAAPPQPPLPWRPVAAAAAIAGLIIAAAAVAGGIGPFGGHAAVEPTPTLAASATATRTATVTPVATPMPSETAAPAPTPTGAVGPAVLSPTPRPPSETPAPSAAPPSSTPVLDPTRTPAPSATQPPSATASRTPEVTPSRTPTPPAPSPTPCVPGPGTVCPTPSATPPLIPVQ